MASDEQRLLVRELFKGTIARRDFIARAMALGMSVSAAAAALATYDDTTGVAHASPAAAPPEASARGNTVIFDMDTGPQTSSAIMNPYSEANPMSHGLEQAVIEPLFILNYGTGKIEPWLGESFTPNASLDVWTLKLHPGITWSDGEAFDADDVVFTINMLKTGPVLLNMWAAPMQQWVKSVRKVDNLTVEFTLTQPNPRFQLDYFAVNIVHSVWIVPEHIWKGQNPLTFTNYDQAKGWPVFTGPYKLTSFSPNQFIYDLNPNWWGAKTGFKALPAPKRLTWEVTASTDVAVAAASNHQLDSVANITLGAFQAMKSRNPNIIAFFNKPPYSWPDPCPRFLALNTTVPPWDDKDMRWALSYAINRPQIVTFAYNGITVPARFLYPAYPALNGYLKLLDDKGIFAKYPAGKFDPAKAAQILQGKGYTKSGGVYQKNGKKLSLEILVTADFQELVRVGRVLTQQLQNFGISVTARQLSFGTWGQLQAVGNYQAAISFSCGSVAEPWSTLDAYNASWVVPVGKNATNNDGRWKNTAYSKLVDQIGVTALGDPKLDTLFVQAMTIWLSELPAIPLNQAVELIPFDTTYWTGWPTAANYYAAPATWSQSNHVILQHLKSTGH